MPFTKPARCLHCASIFQYGSADFRNLKEINIFKWHFIFRVLLLYFYIVVIDCFFFSCCLNQTKQVIPLKSVQFQSILAFPTEGEASKVTITFSILFLPKWPWLLYSQSIETLIKSTDVFIFFLILHGFDYHYFLE